MTRPSRLPLLCLRTLLAAALANSAFAQLPPPPTPVQNPITPEKAVLGKMLFWDEQLSSDNTVACGTCHIPSSGGADPRTGSPESRHPGPDGFLGTPDDIFGTLGVLLANADDEFVESETFGYGPQITNRQSPSTIGAAYFPQLFWDGRASAPFVDPESGQNSLNFNSALESQVVGPPVSSVEMAHEARDWSEITAKLAVCTPMKLASNLTPDIVSALAIDSTYPELFENAFGTTEITAVRIAFAIATYERTLIPDQTPFDLGNLTNNQQQGLNFFNGQGRCDNCHTPPLFSDGTFRNIGLRPPSEDLGRQEVTGNPNDRGRFKVPSLRNVGLRERFFHTGSVPPGGGGPANSLNAVFSFYDRGGDFADNRDPIMNQINVPPFVRNDLMDFLMNGLTDSRVANELPPFDRPTLYSENPGSNPTLIGSGTPGTFLFVPQAIVSSPPAVGTPGFKVGVATGLGGAVAHLMVVSRAPSLGSFGGTHSEIGVVMRRPLTSVVLEGNGAGSGFATVHVDLEDIPAQMWPDVRLQWWIADPAAAGGYARSEVIDLTLLF